MRTTFGPFVFDAARGELFRDDRPVAASHKGIRLLAALLQTPGEVVAKATLMDAAWPGMAVEESNLSVQIAALRKLLAGAHDSGEWIVTVPRVGYRFAGAISSTNGQANAGGAVAARPLIAVMPLEIVSEESGKDYIAHGITDDIITALTRYRWFSVVRGSATALRDKAIDPGEAAHMLGARYALRGSVRYSTQRLRISAQLIDNEVSAHLWAERYDLPLSDVFAIQDEIAEHIVGAIEPELLNSEARRAVGRHSGNMTAWDLVRQGMWHFHKVTREGHHTARELFRRASSIDPDSSEAHSWLGRVNAGLIAYGWSNDAIADGREGTNAAMRAIALDARDPYAYYALAIVSCYAGSANTAALAAQSAINLNSSFALGHLVLGMARLFDGEAERAIGALQHGLKLNPNDPQNVVWHTLLAYAHLLENQFSEALDSAKRALALRPLFGPTLEALACCAVLLGRRDEARRWLSCMEEAHDLERQVLAPMRANQPDYFERIAQWLRDASS